MGQCDSEVKEEDHAVACGICDLWFHIGCQGMPKEVYDFMVNTEEGQQLHWYCVNCKRGSAKLQRYTDKIESQQVEKKNSQELQSQP